MQKKTKRPLLCGLLVDLVLVGLGLLAYAYFHHVMPVVYDPAQFKETTLEQALLQDWTQKFPDKFFTDDTVVCDENGYQSKNIHISLSTVKKEELCYYVADIYLRNISYLKTAFAGGSFSRGVTDYVADMAKENKAILATSGDYFGVRANSRVIRNGVLYRESRCYEVCALYYNGVMETYKAGEFNVDKAMKNGVYQTWDFGPSLLDQNGKAKVNFTGGISGKNPRCGIGYYEPGHYVLVLIDGRQPGYSMGMTLDEMAALFEELGCSRAYNLDGGQSANMAYLGELTNVPTRGGRAISDIIYIADDLPLPDTKEDNQ